MYQTILFDPTAPLTNSELGITNSVAYALGKIWDSSARQESIESFHRPALAGVFERFMDFLRKNV